MTSSASRLIISHTDMSVEINAPQGAGRARTGTVFLSSSSAVKEGSTRIAVYRKCLVRPLGAPSGWTIAVLLCGPRSSQLMTAQVLFVLGTTVFDGCRSSVSWNALDSHDLVGVIALVVMGNSFDKTIYGFPALLVFDSKCSLGDMLCLFV